MMRQEAGLGEILVCVPIIGRCEDCIDMLNRTARSAANSIKTRRVMKSTNSRNRL